VATTRLETANGSIYRLVGDIKIPGKKTVGGKEVPGSITVKVQADKPGDIYNARPGIDLSIPGLIKGTATFKGVYGKTANQFTGGSTGKTIQSSSDEVKQAVEQTKQQVGAEITTEFERQNPEFFLLKDSVQVLTSIGDTQLKDDQAVIKLKLTVKGISLAKSDIDTAIKQYLDLENQVPQGDIFTDLVYQVSETPNETIVADKFNISVKGTTQVVLGLTVGDIQQSIAGKSSVEALSIVQSRVPTQAKVAIKMVPFWKRSIPSALEKIYVDMKVE
jgi:hypothetical protein